MNVLQVEGILSAMDLIYASIMLAADLLLVTKVIFACLLSRSSGKCDLMIEEIDWDY
jgi:hypothetical protein